MLVSNLLQEKQTLTGSGTRPFGSSSCWGLLNGFPSSSSFLLRLLLPGKPEDTNKHQLSWVFTVWQICRLQLGDSPCSTNTHSNTDHYWEARRSDLQIGAVFNRVWGLDSPGSAVVQVSSVGSWNCVGFLSMAAAMRSWKGLLRRRGVGTDDVAHSGSAPGISSSGSATSSSPSFCSSEGVGVDEVLDVGVPGRLLGLLPVLRSRRRTCATLRPGPAAPAPGGRPSSRSGPALSSSSMAGDTERLDKERSGRPLVCSFFCSRFWQQQTQNNTTMCQPEQQAWRQLISTHVRLMLLIRHTTGREEETVWRHTKTVSNLICMWPNEPVFSLIIQHNQTLHSAMLLLQSSIHVTWFQIQTDSLVDPLFKSVMSGQQQLLQPVYKYTFI